MSSILDKIDEPRDVKKLNQDELSQLCSELRELLISRVGENGGHLASNLGAVELTVSLHRVFDSPRDKIIWDVGHQSYVHKLLTGRKKQFPSLRQYRGLSGFADRDESPHDAFTTGHGGTSISAALGMAVTRDLAGGDHHVVAVIGDGCLTCGMTYEALNHAGQLDTRLIVVLNDNGMSISPTVGALAKHLNVLRATRGYIQAKKQTHRLLSPLPGGKRLRETLRRLKAGAKAVVMPTVIWEQLGFAYLGPIDGHSISELETALIQARSYYKPIIVHVLTTKGKGYKPAEDNPSHFHGLSPRGTGVDTTPTYSEIFAQTVGGLLRDNPRVVVISAAMVEGNSLSSLIKEFPQRIYDVGISEQHAVTLAAGLATQGLIPIVAIYSTFLQRAFDQVLHDVCLPDLPVIFALDRSGIVGEDGKTHQGTFDLSYLGLMPNMIICAPKDANELQDLLYTSVTTKHPMAIRYPRGRGQGAPLARELRQLSIGKAEIIRHGEDIAIMGIGSTVMPCLEAAEHLAVEGVDATVINARFAKPLDRELILDAARQVKKMVIVEENVLSGGFGAAVLELLEKAAASDVKVKRLGIPDEFVAHGKQDLLRSLYHLDAPGIARECVDFLTRVQAEAERESHTPVAQ
ncbi:MAG: 1-deoxy-D-xylulose-5-phosphate synthase [Dehalococcoidia bacterium]|nr:1-deoxy-D-xylulose-5-phosphate synthase [Dehalococcoidia bacterium]MDH4366602.1 1-deoxy-D-xylulose-5-phosphate synthase [Dehalococcoidia bacterium]